MSDFLTTPEIRAMHSEWELFEGDPTLEYDEFSFKNLPPVSDSVALPADVRMVLIDQGLIKEPLVGMNHTESEWVETRSWWYARNFELSAKELQADRCEFVFPMIDGSADIYLNGKHLGSHHNAFRECVLDLSKFGREGENRLVVRLTCGHEQVTDADIAAIDNFVITEKGLGRSTRGDNRRAYLRKPQYVFGWDWCPRLTTVGIAERPFVRARNNAACTFMRVDTLKIADNKADLKIVCEVENFRLDQTISADIAIEISFEGKTVATLTEERSLTPGISTISIDHTIDNPALWWPAGSGESHLYDCRVTVKTKDTEAVHEQRFGIRTIEVDKSKIGDDERRFYFEVNGKPIFAKGANWIPADLIYARVTDEHTEKLLKLAYDANFNMIRIWGGGVYPSRKFFDTCDELGLMVWQDYMFVCSNYPEHDETFRREVELEAKYQTRRLAPHPSLALWCGNNEIQWHCGEHVWDDRINVRLHGGLYYNRILPETVAQYSPTTEYWSSSPFGGIDDPNSEKEGDVHRWEEGMMNDSLLIRVTPEEYDNCNAKFVSEYGYVGSTVMESINEYMGSDKFERGGEVWHDHTNLFEKETVNYGIEHHYVDNPEMLPLEPWTIYSGLVQGLIYSYSLESYRFKENCGGGLFWMYNDCWGEIGWSIVDYYLRLKPSFYAVGRAFAPVRLIVRQDDAGKITVICANDTAEDLNLELSYGVSKYTDEALKLETVKCNAAPFGNTVCLEIDADIDAKTEHFVAFAKDRADIEFATLRSTQHRNRELATPDFSVEVLSQDGKKAQLQIISSVYAHAVHLPEATYASISDNYFDLLPGLPKVIEVEAAADADVSALTEQWRHVDDIGGTED